MPFLRRQRKRQPIHPALDRIREEHWRRQNEMNARVTVALSLTEIRAKREKRNGRTQKHERPTWLTLDF